MKTGTIQIVEDEGLIALHLRELLSFSGFNVPDPVATGEDLLSQLNPESLPDLILMDIGLAGRIDGIETSRQLRRKYNIPIIFLTAYADQERVNEVKEIKPCKYLTKPVTSHDLLDAIERV